MDFLVVPPVVGIIQARMSSERLPGKVFLPLVNHKSMLEVLCQRLSTSAVDWWIATTRKDVDDPIARLGRELGLPVFRGPEENVLLRLKQLLDMTDASWFVRVTADNPFTSGTLVDSMIKEIESAPPEIDRIWAKHPEAGYPLGFVPEVVRTSAIRRFTVRPEIMNSHHAAHVTSAIGQSESLSIGAGNKLRRPQWRWTVDYESDLRMARAALSLVSESWSVADYEKLVSVLDGAPRIPIINQRNVQKSAGEG